MYKPNGQMLPRAKTPSGYLIPANAVPAAPTSKSVFASYTYRISFSVVPQNIPMCPICECPLMPHNLPSTSLYSGTVPS